MTPCACSCARVSALTGVPAVTSMRTRTLLASCGVDLERQHLADRQAVEAHLARLAEPRDVVEEHVVVVVLPVELEPRQPDEEEQARRSARPA